MTTVHSLFPSAIRITVIFGSIVLFFYSPLSASAATGINKQINFQGKVVNSDGTNVADGTYRFQFRLYTVDSGGVAVWSEDWDGGNKVQVTDGVFRVALGTHTSLPGSVDFNTDNIYLSVQFHTESAEMDPRIRFTAVPYAFNALKVAGLTVTDTNGTFTLANSKTLTVNNTLTFSGTDGTTFTFPSGNGTVVTEDSTATLTNKTIGSTGLTFENSESISNGTNGALTFGRNDAGIVTLTAKDDDATAALTILPGGAAGLTLGGASTTELTVTTDGTGDGEVVLPDGAIGVNEIYDGITIGAGEDEMCLTYEHTGAVFSWQSCNASGFTAWQQILDPAGDGSIAMGTTEQTMDWEFTTTDHDGLVFNFDNNGGTAGTDNGLVINNAVSTNASGDVATESLLLIQQLDTTASGTTSVDNGLKIDVAANAGMTDGLEITNSAGNLTNAINIVDTSGGTIDKGIVLSGIFSTAGIDVSTASTTNLNKGLSIAQTGATTGTDYAGYFSNTGAATTNVGLYATATGGSNNYAALFDAGNVGIGDTAPDALVEVLGTSEQLRLTHTDGTKDARFTLDTNGMLTIDTSTDGTTGSVFVNDDFYVGASSETIANGTFALDGNDSFISGMLGVEGNIYSDGTINAVDFTCTDCLDFTELADAMTLDGFATLHFGASTFNFTFNNNGSGDEIHNLSSTGDLNIQDNSTTFAQFADSGKIGLGDVAATLDYLVDITSNSTNDYSRALNITQYSNAVEDTYGLAVAHSHAVGVLDASAVVTDYGIYQALLPTVTLESGEPFYTIFGEYTDIDLSSSLLSDTGGPGDLHTFSSTGGQFLVQGTPTIDNSDSGDSFLTAVGVNGAVSVAPSLVTVSSGSTFTSIGGKFQSSGISTGDANFTATSYGIKAEATSNLTTVGTTTHYGGHFTAVGTADTNYGIYITASGADTNYALYSAAGTNYFANDVFVGATSETIADAGFVVNGNDAFIAGMLGVEGNFYTDGNARFDGKTGFGDAASSSDYLLALTGNTANDYSRIIDITQANDATENSTVLNIANTVNAGSGSRTIKNAYLSLAPTLSQSNGNVSSIYGIDQAISLSNLSLGSAATNTIEEYIYGNNVSISGTPVFNAVSAGEATLVDIIGTKSDINVTPTLTAVEGAGINSYGGKFSSSINSSGNINLDVNNYGVYGSSAGDLTQNGLTTHYGGFFEAIGTADTNYGLYVTSSGANVNYGLYVTAGTNILSDDLFVGAASETIADAGFALNGDDAFISGMLGVEGNIYTDGTVVASGLTVGTNGIAGTTGDINLNNFDVTGSNGNTDIGGTITAGSGNVAITDSSGNVLHDSLADCADGQILKWATGGGEWGCAADNASTSKVVVKGSDENVPSGNTLQNDDVLQFAVGASETWVFKFDLLVTNINSATPDWKAAILGAAGWTCNFLMYGEEPANAVFPQTTGSDCDNSPTAVANGTIVADNNVPFEVTIQGSITTNSSGTVILQWAPNTSGSLTVKAGSMVVAQKVGGSDLAEIYYTKDDTIRPGHVVSLDSTLHAGVQKTTKAYDAGTIGIIATKPGLLLGDETSDYEGRQVNVALAGRVPVKVTTENGLINPGDLLTASSIPGVAMRATKAGVIIGQAMSGFAGEGEGEVLTFIKNGYFNGTRMTDVLSEGTTDIAVLESLLNSKSQYDNDTSISEIVTDRVVAGLEIITPKVVAETVSLDRLEAATGDMVTLQLTENGEFVITDAQGNAAITFDSKGNAYFAGLLQAGKIKANQIEGLEILAGDLIAKTITQSDSVDVSPVATASASQAMHQASHTNVLSAFDVREDKSTLTLHVLHDLQVNGALRITGKAYFVDEVTFAARAIFNNDTAGFAVIEKGADTVEVHFEKQYQSMPIINATIAHDDKTADILAAYEQSSGAAKDTLFQQYTQLVKQQEAFEKALLQGDITYIVTRRSTKGFTIKLKTPAVEDVQFSWNAIAVNDAKTAKSVGKSTQPNIQPTFSPTMTPAPVLTLPVSPLPTAGQDEAGQVVEVNSVPGVSGNL